MAILIKNSQRLMKIDRKRIVSVTGELLAYLKLQDRDLSILFVDDRKIAVMNREFFGKDRPTNVISFSYLDGMPGEALGDIIVSVERAAEEARNAGIPFYERLFGLIVHGMVHILGYDHVEGGPEARKMRYHEKKLLGFIREDPDFQVLAADLS
jgi:probable rRNA maturation factor